MKLIDLLNLNVKALLVRETNVYTAGARERYNNNKQKIENAHWPNSCEINAPKKYANGRNVILFFKIYLHMQMVTQMAEIVGYSTYKTLNCHLNATLTREKVNVYSGRVETNFWGDDGKVKL